MLKSVFQKLHSGGGLFFTYYFYHYLSLPFILFFVNYAIRPNTISILSFLVTTISALILITLSDNIPIFIVLSGLFMMLGYILDCCDGVVARLTNQSSLFGKWLDHFLDGIKLPLVNIALGLAAFELSGNLKIILWAYSFNLFGQLLYFSAYNFKLLIFGKDVIKSNSKSRVSLFLKFFCITDYGIFILLTFFLIDINLFLQLYLFYGVICFFLYLFYVIYFIFSIFLKK